MRSAKPSRWSLRGQAAARPGRVFLAGPRGRPALCGRPALRGRRSRRWLLALAAWLLIGCGQSEPAATPTATRTPILPTATNTLIPTSTPTATPTNTPTPTPTLPPGLALAPSAQVATRCPATGAELFFLLDGRIWLCLAEGGQPEPLPVDDALAGADIAAYRVTADRRRVAYVTADNRLWVLDRALTDHTLLPTSGRLLKDGDAYFDFRADGGSVIYLGWGVQLGSGPKVAGAGSGALLAVDALTPTLRQRELAACQASADSECGGFLLSPDRRRLALVDGRGLWLLEEPYSKEPRLWATKDAHDRVEGGLDLRPRAWSPNAEWLLLESTGLPRSSQDSRDAAPSHSYAIISAAAMGQAVPEAVPLCEGVCSRDLAWASASEGQRLWIAWDDGTRGCLAAMDVMADGATVRPVETSTAICEVQGLDLRPSSILAGPIALQLGGPVAFYQAASRGVAAGIYAITADATLGGVALLPNTGGVVTWSSDGRSFLYTEPDGQASRVGVLDSGLLWDVTELLRGATRFTWHSSPEG